MTVHLRVTYRVRSHQMQAFERIFQNEVRPLIHKHRLRLTGMWKTLVGDVGEYMELWEFTSMQAFQESWLGLMEDPELLAVFETTGPMVESEKFTLLTPLSAPPGDEIDRETLRI